MLEWIAEISFSGSSSNIIENEITMSLAIDNCKVLWKKIDGTKAIIDCIIIMCYEYLFVLQSGLILLNRNCKILVSVCSFFNSQQGNVAFMIT